MPLISNGVASVALAVEPLAVHAAEGLVRRHAARRILDHVHLPLEDADQLLPALAPVRVQPGGPAPQQVQAAEQHDRVDAAVEEEEAQALPLVGGQLVELAHPDEGDAVALVMRGRVHRIVDERIEPGARPQNNREKLQHQHGHDDGRDQPDRSRRGRRGAAARRGDAEAAWRLQAAFVQALDQAQDEAQRRRTTGARSGASGS